MNATLTDTLSRLEFGAPQSHRNMSLVPLCFPGGAESGPDYITLGEALAKDLVTVTEVSDYGSVPELKVTNHADVAVLMLDGEDLAGAKQNRVLNTTILLAPQTTTIIPVSCTERGRWAYQSPKFGHSGNIMTSKLRKLKLHSVTESLLEDQTYQSNQGEVWASISALHTTLGSASHTGAMKDAFAAREDDLRGYQQAFPACDGQRGLLVLVGGQPAGLDLVSRAGAYQQLHGQLVRSYAMDVIAAPESEPAAPADPQAAAKRALASIEGCSEQSFASVGVGRDLRFQGAAAVGSALEADDAIVHAAFFFGGDEREGVREQRRSMRSSSRRRAYRRRRRPGGGDPAGGPEVIM